MNCRTHEHRHFERTLRSTDTIPGPRLAEGRLSKQRLLARRRTWRARTSDRWTFARDERRARRGPPPRILADEPIRERGGEEARRLASTWASSEMKRGGRPERGVNAVSPRRPGINGVYGRDLAERRAPTAAYDPRRGGKEGGSREPTARPSPRRSLREREGLRDRRVVVVYSRGEATVGDTERVSVRASIPRLVPRGRARVRRRGGTNERTNKREREDTALLVDVLFSP